MQKRTKTICIILAVIAALSVLTTVAFAIDWNGSSVVANPTPGSKEGQAFRVAGGNVTSDCVGYRFTVLNQNGEVYTIGPSDKRCVLDVYRNTYAYNSYEKPEIKHCKTELIAKYNDNTLTFSTSKNTDGCIMETGMGFEDDLPNPSGMGTWQNDPYNLNPVLQEMGITRGISALDQGYRVIVEPIWKLVLHGYWQALTESEIAVYGIKVIGATSCGGTPSSTQQIFANISYYTNNVWANALYTSTWDGLYNTNGTTLWSKTDPISSTNEDDHNSYLNSGNGASRKNFAHLLTEGYGVGIGYVKTQNYTATFVTDGGTWPSYTSSYPATANRTKNYNIFSDLTAAKWYTDCTDGHPAKSGLTFAGWEVTACTNGNWTVGDFYSSNWLATGHSGNTVTQKAFKYGNVTFTARYNYVATFKLDGGKWGSSNSTYSATGNRTKSYNITNNLVAANWYTDCTNSCSKTGYRFGGWKVTSCTDGNWNVGDIYTSNWLATPNNGTTATGYSRKYGTVEFTAVWIEPTITIYFRTEDGGNVSFGNSSYSVPANSSGLTQILKDGSDWKATYTARGLDSNLNQDCSIFNIAPAQISRTNYMLKINDGSYVWTSKVKWDGTNTERRSYSESDDYQWRDLLTDAEIANFKAGKDVSHNWYIQYDQPIITITCHWHGGTISSTPSAITGWTSGNYCFYEKYGVGYYKASNATGAITKIDVPTKSGYVFGGFYTGENGAGTKVVDEQGNILTTNTYYTANTTIHAKWTPNIYTITCHWHGGTISSTPSAITGWTSGNYCFYEKYNTGYYKASNATGSITQIDVPTKDGYIFGGFYTGENGTGTKVVDEQGNILTNNTFYTANTVIHAKWESITSTLIVDPNGGQWFDPDANETSDEIKSFTKNAGASMDIADPTRTGYKFMGWTKSDPFYGSYWQSGTYEFSKYAYGVKDQLTAEWQLKGYYAFFDPKGGVFGDQENLPRVDLGNGNGYIYYTDEYTGLEYIIDDQLLYARWYGIENMGYTSYLMSDQLYAPGYGLPTREYYTFKGWKVTKCDDGNWTVGQVYTENDLAKTSGMYGDVTFEAQWEANATLTINIRRNNELWDWDFSGDSLTKMIVYCSYTYDADSSNNNCVSDSRYSQTYNGGTYTFSVPSGSTVLIYVPRDEAVHNTSMLYWEGDILDDTTVDIDYYSVLLGYDQGIEGVYYNGGHRERRYSIFSPNEWPGWSFLAGSNIDVSAAVKSGYQWNCWVDASDNYPYCYEREFTIHDLNQPIHIIATSEACQYNINYYWFENDGDYDESGRITDLEPSSYICGTATELPPIPECPGYIVTNQDENTWFANPETSGDTITEIPATKVGDVSVFAYRKLANYNATFVPNGGSWSDGATTTKTNTYTINDILTAPATISKTGYTFAGWKVTVQDGNWGNDTYNNDPQTKLYGDKGKYGDVTFTAQWTPITYTVRFNSNGGTGTMEDQQFTYGTYQTLRPFAFTPATGYHVATTYVWNLVSDGSGSKYKDQQSVRNLTTTPNGIVTLYAQWVPNTSTLNIDPNGGKWNNSTAVASYTKNYNATLDIPVPTREGYEFTGWVKSDPFYGTITSLTKAATYTFCDLDGVSSTLTASWREVQEEQYTATFNPNGGKWTSGSATGNRMVYYTESTTISVPGTVNRSGYSFLGWQIHASVGTWTGGKVYSASQIEAMKNQTGNVTFDAQWEKTEFTITYCWRDDNSVITTETCNLADLPKTLMTVPACNGYTVQYQGTSRWFTSQSGSATTTTIPESSTATDKTFYADRTPIVYTINYYYVTPEGEAVKYTDKTPMSYTVTSSTITLPSPTVPSGYSGLTDSVWHTDTSCTSSAVTKITSGSTGDVNLYTKVVKKYNIVYKWTDGTTISGLNPTYYTSGKTTQLATVPAVDGYTVPMQGTNKWLTSPTGTIYVTQMTPSDYGNKVFYAERVKNDVFYTITCDFNGGSGGTPSFVEKYEDGYYKSATATATITSIPSLPKLTGYIFNGYNTKQNGTGDEVVDKNGKILTSNTYYTADTTIYAQWKPIEYDVRFMGNGATSGHMNDQHFVYDVTKPLTQNAYERKFKVTYVYNDGTTANEDVYAVATFNGWAKSSSGSVVYSDKQSVNNLTTTNNAIVKIYAKWTDASVVLPDPSKPGYKFDGWYPTDDPNPDPDTKIGGPNDPYTPNGDITVYAHWTPIEYDVKFHPAGGTPTGDTTQHFVYDVEQSLTSNPYSKTGYTFTGWNTKSDGSGTPYTNKQVVKNLTTVDGAVIDLYAQWKPIEYDVKFNGNGATSGSMTNQHFIYDQAQNLKANAFERKFKVTYVYNDGTTANSDEYAKATFLGWAKTPSGNKVYNDKQSVLNLTNVKNAIIDVYAKWTDGTIILPNPEKPGYEFDGWYPTDDPNPNPDDKIGDPGDPYTPDEDITIYGHWTPIEYDVKFHANGGTPTRDTTQHFVYDQGQNLTPNPYGNPGYKFNGWNTKSDGTGTSYTDKQYVINLTTVKNDIIHLYAQWQPVLYTANFDIDGGTWASGSTETKSTTYTVLNVLNAPETAIPSKSGYTFNGWSVQLVGSESNWIVNTTYNDYKLANVAGMYGDVTFKAVWIEDNISIRLVPIAQNAPYCENTCVVTSYNIINESNYDFHGASDRYLTATFKIYVNGSLYQEVALPGIVPQNETNLLYFKWLVPEGINTNAIRIDGELSGKLNGTNRTFDNTSTAYATRTKVTSITEEPDFEPLAPAGWTCVTPPEWSTGSNSWSVWVYENNAFVKKSYTFSVSANTVATPDKNANQWQQGGYIYTRSGYGLEFNVTGDIDTNADENAYTGIQDAYVLVPEFMYSTEVGKYRSLEEVDGVFMLPNDVYEIGEDERSHFIPLWFPGGEFIGDYIVVGVATDVWTPAGMISAGANSNTIKTDGTVYDDWHVQ